MAKQKGMFTFSSSIDNMNFYVRKEVPNCLKDGGWFNFLSTYLFGLMVIF